MPTHPVTNQPPPLEGYNAYEQDRALAEAVHREGAAWAEEELVELGRFCGSAEARELGALANAYPPVLHTHDRYGRRRDEVTYHPAYHRLMAVAVEAGAHAAAWKDGRPGAHVARAAKLFLLTQVEAGHGCPVSMTYAAVPALRHQPELQQEWEPRLAARRYDPRFLPVRHKEGATAGMAMTEKQGGSDVRANTTRGLPAGPPGPGREYRLVGHKWFCSAPMSDAFLVLAQAPGGLSCFLVPRWLPDGTRNPFLLQRLKDKLGNRSNASAEVEFEDTAGWLVGEEGQGLAVILEMVNHTRLDCVVGSAAGMRLGVAEAAHHAAHRAAFGKLLWHRPLMRCVLADLALESEAATALAFRLARAFDASSRGDPQEAAFRRLATPVAKYWVCKRAPVHAAEALECLGGNGYVEESGMPRLFRESPLNGIWEGSGNVVCLDVLRALRRHPESKEAFWAELDTARGLDRRLDAFCQGLEREVEDADEQSARWLAERMALALQASLLVRYAPPAVADAFCACRLGEETGRAFGALPRGLDLDPVLDRALVRLP